MHESQASFVVYNASAGSGKTYTLVKNYLKILLNSSNSFQFQQILAMTFTNKAANEMKSRILETLDGFQNKNFSDSMFQDIKRELELSDEVLQKRATNCYNSILNQYGGFHISTIDSFTYKLVKSFAFDLGLSMNFEVEMDPVNLINEAIDVLFSKIGNDKELSKTLIDFAKEKANEDKDWNIEKELQEISKLLLKEDDIKFLNTLKDKKITDFTNLDSILKKRIIDLKNELINIGKQALDIIHRNGLTNKDFYYGDLYNHFLKAKNFGDLKFDGRLQKNIDSDKIFSKNATETAFNLKGELLDLYYKTKNWHEKKYPDYVLDTLVKKSLIPLSVLKSIQLILDEIKQDNNILFNSEFNQIIHQHLSEQPAAFIYEKLGEKFRHYFIDEMQDTSVLQWKNTIPLVKNALESETEKGEKGSLFLVGDAKQSIYRWRGSNPEQFIGLTNEVNPFFVQKNIETLKTNFRSHENIITFNNTFFKFISSYLQNPLYQKLYLDGNDQKSNVKKDGYVEITLLEGLKNKEEKNEFYPKKVLEIIQKLEGKFTKNEICILTRKRDEGVAIANYLSDNGLDIVSSETLLLKNSPKVCFLVDLLKYILQPNDKKNKFNVLRFLHEFYDISIEIHDFLEQYIELNPGDFFVKLKEIGIHFDYQNFLTVPFYESIETIIRGFKLTVTSDAYLQFFLDVVFEFKQKNNSGLTEFISYWEDKKDKLSIVVPQGKDAVNMMTIHKSKGLEFPVVIFAYDLDIYGIHNSEKVWYSGLDPKKYSNFTTTLVNYTKSKLDIVSEIGRQIVKEKTEALELDNFNLLYVALTRAKEQLYVISEYKIAKDTPKKYSELFYEFLQNNSDFTNHGDVYSFGNPERASDKHKTAMINKEQTEFLSTPWQEHQLTIVANTSVETIFDDARKYGTLLHEILSKIETKTDVENAITFFVNKGIIPLTEKDAILQMIKHVVYHPKLSDYFTNTYRIFNEREILTEGKTLLIPDRIAVKNNMATIIDYKTGAKEAKHQQQISNYASVLEKMGYEIENKILVYIQPQEVDVVFC